MTKGLQESKPLTDLITQLAEKNAAKDLYYKGVYYTKWTGHMMAIAGIYFLALKQKVRLLARQQNVESDFKKMFMGKDKPVSYEHAWQCMKAAHVVAEHAVFGEMRSSNSFRNLLLLPGPEQSALAEEMKNIPLDQVAELLPGKIQKRYDELKLKKPPKPMTPEREAANLAMIEKIKKDREDTEWAEVLNRWSLAVIAMTNLLGACRKVKKWKTEYVVAALEKKMVFKLGEAFNEMIGFFHPIEEMMKLGRLEEDEETPPSLAEFLASRAVNPPDGN